MALASRLAAAALILGGLAGCSDQQLASSARSWCRNADNCTDHSKPPRPGMPSSTTQSASR